MRFLDDFVTTNSSNSTSYVYWLSESDEKWKLLWIVTTSLLIIFTVSGNALTLFAVCKMKSFQSSISNLYISSLAAADIVVGSFVMTFMMLYTIAYDGRWIFGRVLCDIWQAVDFISCTVSLYSICAIGFDRWLNLEKPLRIFKRSKIVAQKAILIVWTLPILIWVPILVTIRWYNGPGTDESQCYFPWKPTFIVPLVAVVTFYLPVLMLLVLFVRITSVIRSHFAFLHQHSNQNLLDLERSNNNYRHSSDRSPSVTPTPERRCIVNSPVSYRINNFNNYPSSFVSPRRRSKPPKLSVIHQDDSSKASIAGNNVVNNNSNTLLETNNKHYLQSPRSPTLHDSSNQSPLAMMLLRERLSPTTKDDQRQQFVLPVSQADAADVSKFASSKSNARRVTSSEITPLLKPQEQQQKRSASKESFDDDKSDKSASPIDPGDMKRCSVTSDTAVVFTQRVLLRKPPLVRAQTDLTLEVAGFPGGNRERTGTRRWSRFSVVSITTSLTNFSRRCSMNIFQEILPCPGSFSQQIRAAKAVGIIMIFFLVCWIPFLILWPLKAYCNECVSDKLYYFAIWANYLNSSVNPVLYTLCSPRFQNYFKNSCKCRCLPRAKACTKSLLL